MNVEDYEKMLSIPISEGRLYINEHFVCDCYPFVSDGEENYNARMYWDDESKALCYEIYRVSDRVRGCATGGRMESLQWDLIIKR